ncbi:MAG: hypothetical protein L0Z62_45910 [Gemmataceae bacterium]|nr:hypothetical protein [Gemmataceae bacterium]
MAETQDLTLAAGLFAAFPDHTSLAEAIVEASNEVAGSTRPLEDSLWRSWAPTADEEVALARFLTEYEAAFWSVRRDVLRARPDIVQQLPKDAVRDFLVTLDREIRREILTRIEALPPSTPGSTGAS